MAILQGQQAQICGSCIFRAHSKCLRLGCSLEVDNFDWCENWKKDDTKNRTQEVKDNMSEYYKQELQ